MSEHGQETAHPHDPPIKAEIDRIKELFVHHEGDSEDVPSYAAHVVRLREKVAKLESERDNWGSLTEEFKKMATESIGHSTNLVNEVRVLRARLSTAEAVIGPLAKLASYWLERDEIHGLNDEDTCATEFEFGHLRAAAEWLKGE